MGIHPASFNDKPRDAYGDGWNNALSELEEKDEKIKLWVQAQNLTENQQLKIAELLKNEWMMIYAFRPDMLMNFMVNWSDEDDITNLTLEDIDIMYEYFLKDKNNQEAWVEEVWKKKGKK